MAEAAAASAPDSNEFLCLALHALCQPLQTAELACTAMGAKNLPDRDASDLVEALTGSVVRVNKLVRMLLEISHLESGSITPEEEPVEVGELCNHLERRFGPLARAKALTLQCTASPALIETDPKLLRGMLAQLLSNAISYTSAGEIALECASCRQQGLRIAVHDTGMGIQAHQLQDIFRDFYRTEQARDIDPEGFGLGLGLVRRCSKVLGFPVAVSSRVGHGSTFAIDIPAHKLKVFAAADSPELALPRRPATLRSHC